MIDTFIVFCPGAGTDQYAYCHFYGMRALHLVNDTLADKTARVERRLSSDKQRDVFYIPAPLADAYIANLQWLAEQLPHDAMPINTVIRAVRAERGQTDDNA